VAQHAYDAEGNLLEARDPNRHVKLGYEHFHRVAWREEDGTRLRFEYDTEDRVTAVVNEAGERYTFELDPAGRVVKETGFDGRAREYVRDIAGRPTLTVLPSGSTTASTYDVMNRLVEAKHSDKTFAKFEYAVDGLLTRAENEASVVEMERDSLGRVVREVINGRAVESQYGAGARTQWSSSLGGRLVVDRDPLGLPKNLYAGQVDGFREQDVHIRRDGSGLETSRAFRNGIDLQWSRDVGGRPLSRRTLRRNTAARAGPGPEHAPREIDARRYEWRGEDQITAIYDAVSGPSHYDLDGRGRVIRERSQHGIVERAMDAVGNIYRSRTGSDRRYGPGGRLEMADGIRYVHDEDGNQVLKSGPNGDWHYRWNGHGFLRIVERPDGVCLEFDYDPFARRTARRVYASDGTLQGERLFVWDGSNLIHELDSEAGLTTWYWEPESFVPVLREQAGTHSYVVTDHLGAPTEIYDELGLCRWRMRLDVFGVARIDVGNARECPWRWPGQYEDDGAGLVYNHHRWYDPQIGAYLSRDPIGLAGGTRLFGYVTNPLTFIDPRGEDGHHTIPKELVQGMRDQGWLGGHGISDKIAQFRSTTRAGMWDLPRDTATHSGADGPHITAHKALSDYLNGRYKGLALPNGFQHGPDWDSYLRRAGSLDTVLDDFDNFYRRWLPDRLRAGDYPSVRPYSPERLAPFDNDRALVENMRRPC
jgi:RHS repeat-associated protein